MLVLTWNLFHGRAVPSAGRPLLSEYAATIAGWGWDLALLQEVPPWWPPILAAAAGARAPDRTDDDTNGPVIGERTGVEHLGSLTSPAAR